MHLIETHSTHTRLLLFRIIVSLCKKKQHQKIHFYTFLLYPCAQHSLHSSIRSVCVQKRKSQRYRSRLEKDAKTTINWESPNVQVKNSKCPCPFSFIFTSIYLSSGFIFFSLKRYFRQIHANNHMKWHYIRWPKKKNNKITQNLYKSICVSFEVHYSVILSHLPCSISTRPQFNWIDENMWTKWKCV